MTLDKRIASLIAVGASIPANCQPCLEASVTRALKRGADPHEVGNAIDIGKKVRDGAASKIDACAAGLIAPAVGAVVAGQAKCGCGF